MTQQITTVAFPMYVLPQMQADMRNLWVLLRTRLQLAGYGHLAEEPGFDDPLHGGDVPASIGLIQYCGFPYVSQWREHLRPLACLHYDAPHCEGKMHRSVIIVSADNTAKSLEQLRGSRAAINGYDSNTGMNLLRHAIAPLAGGEAFFSDVTVTGAHVESLRAVAEGRADVAAIDCVTFAYIGDYYPEWVAKVRVLATTADSPALPLFTRRDASEAWREALLAAWKSVLVENRTQAETLLNRLRMRDIEVVTEAELDVIAHYADAAAQQGYPTLI
jgi:ABC-type phosphate/phosphonate transport system substrate-binding protein